MQCGKVCIIKSGVICLNKYAISKLKFCILIDILKVKIISESCDDAGGTCSNARGHITVNGHQHSLSYRGVNIVLFDYRSGIYEHRNTYDVLVSTAARTDLANFLNGLSSGKILFMAVQDAVAFSTDAALALQRFGVSASFATTSLPKSRCSMATISYTGQERKKWENSVNTANCIGASIIEKNIHVFRDLNGRDDCSQEMGVQSRKIPDSGFTAESIWQNFDSWRHMPYQARIHQMLHSGWCSGENVPVSDFIQVDLGTVKILTGLAIQGHGTYYGHHYITKFSLEYSIDGYKWLFYTDIGSQSKKVFDGIRRLEVIETRLNWFQRTMMRFIKIVPSARVSAHGTTCLRMELYGCTPQTPIFIEDDKGDLNMNIQEVYTKSLKVHYAVPKETKVGFEISTAADDKTLSTIVDQVNFKKMNGSIVHDNGTVETNSGMVQITQDELTKVEISAKIEFNAAEANYYVFNTNYTFQVSV